MKKIITLSLLVIFLSVCTDLQAQHRGKKSSARNFDFELRGGLNFCQIDGDAAGSYNKIGYHASVGSSMPISDDGKWRFSVEIGLTQKGSRFSNNTFARHISLLYVEVPLMIAYDFGDSRKLRIGAGVAPAILAKANVTTNDSYDYSQSNNYKTLDMLPICVGVRYLITDHIGVDARYYNSMLNTAKENGSGTYRIFRSNKGQFNRLIQAGISLTW